MSAQDQWRRRAFRRLTAEPLERRLLLTTVTALNPPANSHSAHVSTDVAATFDQSISQATATTQSFVVHSIQRGQLVNPSATVSTAGATVALNPVSDFFPGERIQASVTSSIQSSNGQGADSQVWQLRTAVRFGSGEFSDSGQSLGSFFSRGVSLGDLDGDGDLDAFVANFTQGNRVWINQGGSQGGTAGVFSDSGQSLGSFLSRGVSLGDLDGDGDLDAFVANLAQGNRVWINQGGSQGGTPGVFSDSGQSLGSLDSNDVSLGDVDGDGDLDAFVANRAQRNSVWTNQGGAQGGSSGMFSNSGQSLGTGWSQGVSLGDVDDDGDLDAFVANRGGDRLWLNQGDTAGTFSDSGQSLGAFDSQGVSLGDVDGDGDLDAFVAIWNQSNLVWLNQGGAQGGAAGTFNDNGQSLGGTYRSYGVSLGDLDGDGDLDAFVANDDSPDRVFLNQGGSQGGTAGTFSESYQSLGESASLGLGLGDVDGDGDLDAFVANETQGNFVWLAVGGNRAPTLDVISSLTLDQDAPQQSVNLTGITAGAGESQPLKVTAASSNTSLIPDPTVSYTSPNTTGTLTFTSVASATGTATITVTVEDGGLDNNLSTSADNAMSTLTFDVTVNPAAAKVTGESLNGGSANRSGLANLTLNFDAATTVNSITSLQVNHTAGASLDISSATLANNSTTAITWDLSSVSLPDGYYSATLPRAEAGLSETHSFLFHVLAGDSSGDGQVGFADFGDLANAFNTTAGPIYGPGDLNGDGNVDFTDFGILANSFNQFLNLPEQDFGDAPENGSYPTTLANNGARHILGSGLFLGSAVDAESDGQPDASAAGDDNSGPDEDGVTFAPLQAGANASVTVTANVPGTALLNAWIDFNRDGDWDDVGEQVFVDQGLSNGANALSVAIPSGATAGSTFARFRVARQAGYSYYGLASDGEVEDYQVNILAAKLGSRQFGAAVSLDLWASAFVGQTGGPSALSRAPDRQSKEAVWRSLEPTRTNIVDLALVDMTESEIRPAGQRTNHLWLHEELADLVYGKQEELLL